MNRLKCLPLLLGCSMMLGGCLYDQKKIVDPATPVISEQERLSGSRRVKDSANRSVPIQDDGRPDVGISGGDSFRPSVDEVASRIAEYNKKLDRWRERDSRSAVTRMSADDSEKMVRCFHELQKVLNGYNRLHEILLQQTSMPRGGGMGTITAKEMVELQQSDIAFVDGFCGQVVATNDVKGTGWAQSADADSLASMEAMIAQYAANGQNEELVQHWKQMPESMAAGLQLSSKIFYGNALMALQQEEEAVQVYRRMVDQMMLPDGQSAGLLSLRKNLADLYVATGNYRDAEVQYLEISKEYREMGTVEEWAILQLSMLKRSGQGGPELQEYADLLKNYLGFNPVKDGYTVVWQADKFLQTYPYSPVASNVDIIRTSARAQADKWSNSALAGMNRSAVQQGVQEESSQPETASDAVVKPGSEAQPQGIKSAEPIVPVVKVETENTRIASTQELEGQWNEAVTLVEGAQYDKAIEKLISLRETEFSARAEKKIVEASLLAAEAERRKAADIFIRFTKASDVESKKKLLIEARSRLLDILRKYPNVEIRDKVMGNIKRVEKEMNAIDPGLVPQSGRISG